MTGTPPILAWDPGSRRTGLVLRDGDTLLGHRLLVRQEPGRIIRDGIYLRQVVGAGIVLLTQAGIDPSDRDAYVVVVESVAWWPSKRNQSDMFSTAAVYGAILTRWPDAIVVDPGRGVDRLHPDAYPEEIRPPVEGKRTDQLGHVRASYDHSFAGETIWLERQRDISA